MSCPSKRDVPLNGQDPQLLGPVVLKASAATPAEARLRPRPALADPAAPHISLQAGHRQCQQYTVAPGARVADIQVVPTDDRVIRVQLS